MARNRSRRSPVARPQDIEKAVQAAVEKALNPGLMAAIGSGNAGAAPRRFGLMDAINAATNDGQTSQWQYAPLPRNPLDRTLAFGPGEPLHPQPIDPPNPHTGQPDPRIWEYPQSWNLPGNMRREVPWQVLRAASVGVDIIRRCVEHRKRHIRTLQWGWNVKASVIQDAYAADPSRGGDDIAADLRAKFSTEINRLTEFLARPWPNAPGGGWDFEQWANSLMEEYLVFDGIAIYPRHTYGGALYALEQVDASTIKPLLDYRGAMPLPPHPAYQQEVNGFARGEYAARVERTEDGTLIVPNAYKQGELFYYRENARVHSPYGLSAVEMALQSARLYLKRQGWLIAEYDDGSTPLTVWEVPKDQGKEFGPKQRRDWERALNEELAGQTAARHRMKVGFPGWTPHQLSAADERYKPELDLFLIKLVVGHFGLTATELGFAESQGLGGAGFSENQSDIAGRVGLKPDVKVLAGIVNAVSRAYLAAPTELEFSFLDPTSEDDAESDQVANAQRTRGTITINDDRRRLKLPLLPIPEADKPFLISGTGPVFLEGAFARQEQHAAAAVAQQQAVADGTTAKVELEAAKLDDGRQAREEDREFAREQADRAERAAQQEQKPVTKAAASGVPLDAPERTDLAAVARELAAFRTWRKRNPNPRRPFTFKAATPDDAPDLADLPPTVVEFGPGWEWIDVAELLKAAGMDWRAWNAAHPERPRDARGRWVKRGGSASGPLADILQNAARPRAAISDEQIRAMDDDQLYETFADISAGDSLDEGLARRLIADMDRREELARLDREHPWLAPAPEAWDWNAPAEIVEPSARHRLDDAGRRQHAAAAVDRRPGESVDRAVRRAYDEHVHLAYLAAEQATRGHVLNRAGAAAGINPIDLFSGPLSRVRRYASEDLLRFWAQHGRLNFTEFRGGVLGRERDLAAARATAGLSAGKDFI